MIKVKSKDEGLNSYHTKFQPKMLNGVKVMMCLRGAPFLLGHTVQLVS